MNAANAGSLFGGAIMGAPLPIFKRSNLSEKPAAGCWNPVNLLG